MIRRGRPALLAATAVSLALLSGCAGAKPASTPTDVPSELTPTPTFPAAEPTVPQPVFDLTCDDLATEALTALLPADEDRVARDGGARLTNDSSGPGAQYSVRSLGGLACEWSNGLTRSADGMVTLVGVEVMILPNGTSQYERWIAGYLDGTASCRGVPLYCDSNELVGTTWVSITATATTGDGFADYAAKVRDLVANAGPGAAPWVPETTVGASGCDGIIAAPAISAALGIEKAYSGEPHAGGWSIEAAAKANFGTVQCVWHAEDPEDAVGFLTALPGGVWAWKQVASALTKPATPVTMDLAGLAVGDEAWVRCADADTRCVVDLILGSDWIEFSVWVGDSESTSALDVRTGVTAIATEIVNGRS